MNIKQLTKRPKDQVRVARAVLAWHRGDRAAFNLVLHEAATDEDGRSLYGIVSILADFMAHTLGPDGEAQLLAVIESNLDADDAEAQS